MHSAAAMAAALALAPGAGLACSPVPFTPAPGPVAGGGCSVVFYLTEIRAVGLGPAKDLGQGLVMQDIFDGNACYWEANLIVLDCAARRALVIGHDDRALMAEPRETGIDRIAADLAAAAAAGRAPVLDDIAAAAAAEGYATRLALQLDRERNIEVNGQRIAIDCACAAFYPGGRPAN
ncbi:MAG: hypothetical protein KJZ85_06945 [Rhodobacteraceae bacterium]|jgi:hypothetical protein|nr:hypothetical protein [Paracoccaceae bacterium]